MKHRRALLMLSLLCLLAVTQCGCVLGFRDVPAAPASHPVTAIQGTLLWAVLFGVLGIGVGVFMLVEFPFKKLGLAVALGSAAMIASCLYFAWVAEHIGWFVLGVSAAGAIALLWSKLKLKNAARVAWDAVPDGVVVASKAESLLNKL